MHLWAQLSAIVAEDTTPVNTQAKLVDRQRTAAALEEQLAAATQQLATATSEASARAARVLSLEQQLREALAAPIDTNDGAEAAQEAAAAAREEALREVESIRVCLGAYGCVLERIVSHTTSCGNGSVLHLSMWTALVMWWHTSICLGGRRLIQIPNETVSYFVIYNVS